MWNCTFCGEEHSNGSCVTENSIEEVQSINVQATKYNSDGDKEPTN